MNVLLYIYAVFLICIGPIRSAQGQSGHCFIGESIENRQNNFADGLVVILPTLMIPCSGTVTRWEYWAGNSGSFRALMVRPTGGNSYRIVGINDITVTSEHTNKKSVYNVPLDNRFQVQSGDMIAVGIPNDNPQLELDSMPGTSNRYKWMNPFSLIAGGFLTATKSDFNTKLSISVRVVDTTPPSVESCPTDINVDIAHGVSSHRVLWQPPSATDLSGNVSLVSQNHHPGDKFPRGRTGVEYVFIDGSGNEARCLFYVSLHEVVSSGNDSYVYSDTTPPIIINCPLDINTTVELGQKHVVVSWVEPIAIDVNGFVANTIVTHKPGELFDIETSTKVSYVFTDDSYNSASCNFSVNFKQVDTISPKLISCPKDITMVIEVGNEEKQIFWTEPTATDISGNVSLNLQSHHSGENFTIGVTDVTYVFGDSSGNKVVCGFSVEVKSVDTKPPLVVYCPSEVTINASHQTTAFWREPVTKDESGNVTTLVKTHSPGDVFDVGSSTVLYMFADQSNNIASCTFIVKAQKASMDTEPPKVINCPSDITVNASEPTSISWIEPTTEDESNVTTLVKTHSPGDVFDFGTTTVMYLFADQSYNIASCTFNVKVHEDFKDSKPPRVVNCPSDIIVNATGSLQLSWIEPTTTDESNNVTTLVKTHSPGDVFDFGTTTVLYMFADKSNNIASCTFTVKVHQVSTDTEPPKVIGCPSDVAVNASEPTNISWIEPKTEDESNVTTLVKTHSPDDIFDFGTTTVMYLFIDKSNNIASCTFTVKVRQASTDTEPPKVIGCPSDVTVNASGPTSISWIEPTTEDESSVTTLVKTHTPGDLFAFGSTTVLYMFSDQSKNIASCTFTVEVSRVSDWEPPNVLNCPSDMTVNASKATPVSWIEPTTDAESGNVITLVKTHSPMDLFEVGTTTVLYMFADQFNNIASCTFKVKVRQEDNKSPKVVQCPSDITVNSSGPINVSWIEPSTEDDSEVTTLVKTHSQGDVFEVGSTTILYLFADQYNNIASCTFTVKVRQKDNQSPKVVQCPSDITVNSSDPTTVSWIEPSTEDDSKVTTLVKTHSPGDIFDFGTTTVMYLFADQSNNIASCTFTVKVRHVDTTKPIIISCPNNMVTQVDPGNLGTTVSWQEPMAEDSSGDVMLLVQTHVPGSFFAVGTTIVSYIFRDKSNNMEKCSFFVTVTGVNKTSTGILNCPSKILTTAGSNKTSTAVTWEEPFAVNLSPSAKVSSTHTPNQLFPLGSTEVVYLFEDNDGFKQYCNFTVVVTKLADNSEIDSIESLSDKAASSSEGEGISIAALALCLLVIVFIIVIVILQLIIQKRSRDKGIHLDGLQLSAASSLKSLNSKL